jgi:hypothetical protein
VSEGDRTEFARSAAMLTFSWLLPAAWLALAVVSLARGDTFGVVYCVPAIGLGVYAWSSARQPYAWADHEGITVVWMNGRIRHADWRDVTDSYRGWPATIHLEIRGGAHIKLALLAVRAGQRHALASLVDRAASARASAPCGGAGSRPTLDAPWDPFDSSA